MAHDRPLDALGIALRLAGAAAIVVGAAALGLYLGKVWAPDYLPGDLAETGGEGDTPVSPKEDTKPPVEEAPKPPPPIYLHLGIEPDSQWDVLDAEVAYAAGIGLHRYMIPAHLPWSENDPEETLANAITRIRATDPEATFILQLDFNPPPAWFEDHPEARMAGTVGDGSYPSPASEAWRTACRAAFDRLRGHLAEAELAPHVSGYALYGLLLGNWQRGPGADTSEANTAAFRAWLERTYEDDAAIQDAWGNEEVALADATVPETGEEASPAIFYELETDQRVMDYHRFAAVSVADAIGALSAHIRETAGDGIQIWANYGHTFEKGRPGDGHLALGTLLDSDVDAFLSPVSMANRGIGAPGGFMGPIDSARAHGKTWVLVDDTRTGIAWNKETGQIEQMRGLRAEDVHNVQRRNFAMAAVHGLSLVWSDPEGEGFFHDDVQWRTFEQLYTIYQDQAARAPAQAEPDAPGGPETPTRHPIVQVVVDEASQFLTRPAAGLDALLHENRDVLLQSGVSTAFCLLDDVLDSRIEPSPVYVFLNAYQISAADVKRLHARFAEEKATAIWLYAPGYLDVTMIKNNVRDTVGMNIRKFDEPSPGGSRYALSGGHWIGNAQSFGAARLLDPLFYIDDPGADVLAEFQQSEKPSVALRVMDEGWTSIFVAEPRLSPALLRELLRILEQPVYFRPGAERLFDPAFINQRLVAIHADEPGERIVNLGRFYDIVDLFDASIGWPEKESFVLNLKKGETRLFHLTLP